MNNDIEQVTEIAQKLRSVIETIPHQDLPAGMRKFPKGACGNSAILLGAYFTSCGIKDFIYIQGRRGSRRNDTWAKHAWLAREDLVVDITADQFPDAPAPVIVADPSPWHETFKTERLTDPLADRILWNTFGVDELYRFYNKIHPEIVPRTT